MALNHLISIIVPVYNTENYLPKCLDSLVNQTYKNIEIICVNDGSNDNSLQILNEYALKDNRIKIINQENSGVSVARNVGIDNASGDYIMFVDSDDWLDIDACQQLMVYTEYNFDILFFNTNNVNKSHINKNWIRYNKQHSTLRTFNEFICDLDTFEKLNLLTIWGKLYRKDSIKNNRFDTRLNYGEDTLFCAECILKNPKTIIINDYLYNHRIDSVNSLTKQNKIKIFKQMVLLINNIKELCDKNNIDNELKIFMYDKIIKSYVLYYDLIYSEYKNEFLEKIEEINGIYKTIENKAILNNLSGYKRFRLFYTLSKSHLVRIYLYFIRPIGKYCIVLPYRRVKELLRSKRNGA